MSVVLEMSAVALKRGNKTLLRDVNWRVHEGEHWVILGPNGAGKTTLAQLAAARLYPSSGQVQLLDEMLGSVDVFSLRSRIGFSSEALTAHIAGHEKVLDVVVTGAYGFTGRWGEAYDRGDERRAFALLQLWGIDTLLNRPIASLSDGERKRTLVARSLMANPELLVLDEPAAGLDLAGREDLVTGLETLTGDVQAPAIVMATHHLEEIAPGFTHALLLKEGEVFAQGRIDEVLTEQHLAQTFDLPIALNRSSGRFSAKARRNSSSR